MSEDTRATDPGEAPGAVGAPRQASLLRSSAIMASGTMVSRILGFVRAALLVAAIGSAAGAVSTSFQVANTLPNTVYNLLAAGVFDAVLVPQIVRALKRRSGDVYVNRLLTLAGVILFGVTLVAMVAAPLLVTILAGSFTGQMRTLTIAFSLICLPQIFFYGLYNLLGELLNARGVFGPYMWAPVVNNVVAIAGLVVFIAMFGSTGSRGTFAVSDFTSSQFWILGGTATLGVICQALVLVIPIRRSGVSVRPDFRFRGTSFGTASKVAGWTFATLGISQLGVISTTQLATRADAFADANNIATMAGYTAYTTMFMIYMVPQSLISVSLATAIFTRLADAAADRDHRTVAEQYTTGLTLITLLSLLSAAVLIAGATPMVQLIIPGTTDPGVIHAYALVLTALMPGVASTGMVLMSQRVFFAYEDARPVFLMGIVPTLIQIIVGWSIYALADAQWWTFGAALAETVCRLTQGFIAVFWVARKNSFVNPGRIIATYLKYLTAAVAAWAVAYLVVRLIGPMTLIDNGPARFLVSALKLVLVALVAAACYVAVLRVVDPANASAALSHAARRLRVPARLSAFMAGRASRPAAAPDAAPSTGLPAPPPPPTPDEMAESVAASRTGWSMIGRQWAASDPTHTGEFPIIRPSARPEDPLMSIPSFDDILHPADDGAVAPPPAPGHPFIPPVHEGDPGPDEPGTRPQPGDQPEPDDQPDQETTGDDESAGAPATAGQPAPAVAQGDAAAPGGITTGSAGAAAAAIGAAAATARRSVASWIRARQRGGDDAPETPQDGLTPPPEPPSPPEDTTGDGGDPGDGRTRVDPTVPAMVMALVLVIGGGIWGFHQAFAPVSAVEDLAQSLAAGVTSGQSESGAAPSGGEGAQPSPHETVSPVIQAAKVFSWNSASGDRGDHDDLYINLIDGDPSTQWYSRYYDLNQFSDDNTVTILLTLEQTSTLSGITLSMDPGTSGGELVVRAVDDPANPRAGTELATTALSPTTQITLDPAADLQYVSLSFRTMPTDSEGLNRAWISEITVQ